MELPAGIYEWIRLDVKAERGLSGGANDGDSSSEVCDEETENSYLVTKSGETYNLFIPSGSQRGLQLIKDIIILFAGIAIAGTVYKEKANSY